MIRPEALTRLRLLVGTVPPLLVAGEPGELPPLQPGQPIDGRVEQQFRTGYIVAIGGRSFEIKLPGGTRPGDLLRMVYVGNNPRPTFALLGVDRADAADASKLSDAGKLLAMLQDIQTEESSGPAARASTPIFQSRLPDTPQSAALLREALTLSGLFYESHQAQWILGTRSTAQLQREPQGKLAPMQPPVADEVIELQAFPLTREALREVPAFAGEAPATTAEPDVPAAGEQIARSPAHPDTFPIIRQQLNALESGHVAWHGVVWPGQTMEWQVGDGGHHAEEGDAVPRTWRTELKLTLPNIGELVARIELDASGARLRLIADSDEHARRLRSGTAALADRFDASGIPIHALEVSHGNEAA